MTLPDQSASTFDCARQAPFTKQCRFCPQIPRVPNWSKTASDSHICCCWLLNPLFCPLMQGLVAQIFQSHAELCWFLTSYWPVDAWPSFVQSSICEEPECDESDDLEPMHPDNLAQQLSGTCGDGRPLLHPGTCGDSLVLQGSLSDWQAQPEADSSPCTSPLKHTGPGAGAHLGQQPPGLEEVSLHGAGQHGTPLPEETTLSNPPFFSRWCPVACHKHIHSYP